MADGLLVNGTNIASLGRIVQDFGSALGGAPTIRNDADVVPRRRGSVATDSITGSAVLPVKMLLLGQASGGGYSRPQYHDYAAALRALVFNRGRAFTLTRTRQGTAGTVMHEATARYLGGLGSPEQVAAHGGRVAFDLEVFGGYFYDTAETGVAPGTPTIPGDADTRKLRLDLPGPGTLANATTGTSVTVADNCVLDVEAFTSSIPARLATLAWNQADDYWFVLAPGANTITWSGAGTPTVYYKAAWL